MFTLVVLISCLFQDSSSKVKPEARTEKQGKADGGSKTSDIGSPEHALRTFLIAMFDNDIDTLRSVTLPTGELNRLISSQAPPAAQLEEIKTQIKNSPIRTFKPGDEVTLPGNRKLKIKPEDVTADRTVLHLETMPFPFRLRKLEGRWRVDATPVIAARKAAEAAKKKKVTQ